MDRLDAFPLMDRYARARAELRLMEGNQRIVPLSVV
jgi:hypothetical protein